MHGRISASLAGNIVDAESWNIDVQRLETTDLQIVAPELVGQNPAKLAMIAATGRASLSNAEMKIDNAQLACDFSNVSASATVPWPLALPTAQEPFFAGGTLAVQGSVDLPKLVRAAETLLPLREGTQLLDGTAQFAIPATEWPRRTHQPRQTTVDGPASGGLWSGAEMERSIND
jgi:hypothetical protein